jgi:cytochrome bd ubiquinol oxidase subunit I
VIHLLAITPVPVPQDLLGNRLWVGIVAVIHVQYATFLTGASTLAIISEGIAISRKDERHARLSAGIVKGMAYLFSFGAAIPIFWVLFVFLGLWGTFFIALTQITYWIFILEACTFLLEIVILYVVYANWSKLERYRHARFGLLILLNVVLFWQMFFIDVVASYMLTPNGGDTSQLGQVLNPTDLPLTAHRFIGNIAWAGTVVAAFAAFRYRRAVRHEEALATGVAVEEGHATGRSVGAMAAGWYKDAAVEDATAQKPGTKPGDRAFYDFVMQWGVLFAVGFTLLQPFIGYSYAKEVQLHAFDAWYMMMYGELSNVFLIQITLLGGIFCLGALFFWRRLRASGALREARSARNAFVVLVAVTAFAAIPARFAWNWADIDTSKDAKPWWDGGVLNPIGTFIPNKVIALLLMMVFGLWALTAYLTAVSRDRLHWGEGTRRTTVLAFALVVVTSAMMSTMAIIREHSRSPYLIYGELTISNQQVVNAQPAQTTPAPGRPSSAPSTPASSPTPGTSPQPRPSP